MSEDVVPHLACEASAANAAICSQTLSFKNVLRWTYWNSDSERLPKNDGQICHPQLRFIWGCGLCPMKSESKPASLGPKDKIEIDWDGRILMGPRYLRYCQHEKWSQVNSLVLFATEPPGLPAGSSNCLPEAPHPASWKDTFTMQCDPGTKWLTATSLLPGHLCSSTLWCSWFVDSQQLCPPQFSAPTCRVNERNPTSGK